ncbi:Putative ubiquitin-conjugating enzyme E2 25 [Glycine soja]|uniref:Putative ubiquitin-conjugating enzyme E2 25 n=1 Tax=Glycine soja TaxID=3848 RepID=A0A0B2QWI6_GLYSO|nr:Putative ubiquitin-conjugating enzyme E2 25 [Glycine soja]
MDPNVIEIPPPTANNNNTCNSIKQKEAIFHHGVINTDKDNDSTKLILFGQKVGKGKAIQTTHQNMEVCEDVMGKSRWTYGHSSSSESSNDEENDDNCFDFFSKDYMTSQPSFSLEPTIKDPSGVQYSQTPLSKKKSNGSQQRRRKLKLPWEMGSSKSFESEKKPNICYSSNHEFVNNFEAKKLPLAGGTPHWGLPPADGAPDKGLVSMMTIYNPYHSNFVGPAYHHPGSKSINQMWSTNAYNLQAFPNYNYYYPYDYNYTAPFAHHFHVPPGPLIHNSWVYNSVGDGNNEATANNTVATISDEARGEILRKFQSFKQFDVIEDVSDHHFVHANSSMEQHSKHWAKRIQGEWKSLEKDLPDSIFVRVYESRIDLLRAVIIGAEGTPYHDGLFFFDVFFPSGYSHVPPNFKDFVAGNFCSRAHDILVACKAYIDGAQVGCVVKGGAQDVDQGDSSSSVQFRTSLAAFVNMLVNEFTQVGAKDCDKVFPLTAVGNSSNEMLKTVGNPSGVKLTAVGNMSGEMVAAVGNASDEMLVAAAAIP